jgi:hypothetical protein
VTASTAVTHKAIQSPVEMEAISMPLTWLPTRYIKKPFRTKVRIGYSQTGSQESKLINTHQKAVWATARKIVKTINERNESALNPERNRCRTNRVMRWITKTEINWTNLPRVIFIFVLRKTKH